ncbi:PadR family transcriptional regulator [Candidatus Woesearchaeota archaeon]|nr:PadR family transcriptional regulator [Candidatus Woesearchaeota archaeon]
MVDKKVVVKKKSKKVVKANVVSESPFIEFKGLLSFLILHELSSKALAGEDLAKKIGKRKGTVLTPGTIYPALKKLKNKRLVRFEKQGRRKVYFLTVKGKHDLDLSYSLFSRYFFGLKNKIRRIKR